MQSKNTDLIPAYFECDGISDSAFPGYHCADQHWNGFAVPAFTKETGELIAAAVRERSKTTARYDAERDVFIFQDFENADEEAYPGAETPHGRLYAIGAGYWCWSLEDERTTALRTAASLPDLDESARVIQDHLGVSTGDAAAQFFSGSVPEAGDAPADQSWDDAWPHLSAAERLEKLREYISFENAWKDDAEKDSDGSRYSLCEAVADIATNFERASIVPGDSRERIRLIVQWAQLFERKFSGVEWGVGDAPDYIESIDSFYTLQYLEWLDSAKDTRRND